MMTLDQIGLETGTDKASNWHDYLTGTYAPLLDAIPENGKLLEIGVEKGASMNAWKRYRPDLWVGGIDINPNVLKYDLLGSVLISDITDKAAVGMYAAEHGPFDLVIDDGAHDYFPTYAGMSVLWPYVKPGGAYVIEDLHCAYPESGWGQNKDTINWIKNMIDELNSHGRSDAANPANCSTGPMAPVSDIAEMIFRPSLVIVRKRP